MYTGRTPYAGARTSSKDARHVKPILEYQTRPRLWVHISVGSMAEKSGSGRPEPAERLILAQESDYQ